MVSSGGEKGKRKLCELGTTYYQMSSPWGRFTTEFEGGASVTLATGVQFRPTFLQYLPRLVLNQDH